MPGSRSVSTDQTLRFIGCGISTFRIQKFSIPARYHKGLVGILGHLFAVLQQVHTKEREKDVSRNRGPPNVVTYCNPYSRHS